MRLLEKVCKKLGVEVGEIWEGSDGMKYTIGKTGKIFQFNANGFHLTNSYDMWEDIFTEKLNPVWKPEWGEDYFTPNIYSESKYFECIWTNSNLDNQMLNRGLVFRTKDEAEKITVKMLNVLGGNK